MRVQERFRFKVVSSTLTVGLLSSKHEQFITDLSIMSPGAKALSLELALPSGQHEGCHSPTFLWIQGT